MTRYSISSGQTCKFRAPIFLAMIVLLGCSTLVHAQGLVYVDARDQGYGYPYANLYSSAGAEIPVTSNNGILDPLTGGPGAADGQWHWRSNPQFGVPSDGFDTIYASESENAPEIRMVLRNTDGLAAATNYDIYVVYWSDRGGNWNIRAGLTSGSLTLFDRIGSVPNTATAGTFASAAAWTTPPANSVDTTGDDNVSPFVSHTPTTPDGSTRDMYMGFVGTAQMTNQTIGGSSASVISVFLDDLPQTANANERSWIEGLAFVPTGTTVFLTGSLDRDTGNLTINNPTNVAFNIASYSITSAGGALNGTQWQSITNNNILPDPNNDWSITSGTPIASQTALSEADGGGSQPFAVLPAGTGVMNFGNNVWRRTPIEDAQVSLTLTNGGVVTIIPEYTGDAITAGDFTGPSGTPDGAINQLDYLALIGGLHVNHATDALAYAGGDITLDGLVDRTDVLNFRNVFNNMNGAGSFDAMIAGLSVPEPSVVLLGAIGVGWMAVTRRRRRSKNDECQETSLETAPRNRSVVHHSSALNPLVAVAIVAAVLANSALAQVPVVNWSFDPLITGPAGQVIADPTTNHPNINLMDGQAVVWANMPSAVQLLNGEELVLSGRVTFTGIDGNESGGFRWGFFRDGFPYTEWNTLDPPPTGGGAPATRPQVTTGWLGYLANASAGGPNGRLEAKNPDAGGFFTASHMSTFGGSTANFAGPCDNAATTANTGAGGPGCGNPVFNLANGGPTTGLGDGEYEFQIVVGRYGEEVTVSASLVEQGPTADYSLFLGGGIDHNGRPPAGYAANNTLVVPRPHLAFEFNRVSFLFAGSVFQADQADFVDVFVTPRAIESLTLEIDLANNGAGRFVNESGEDFDMIYYEITSESGSLKKNTWDPFDPTPLAAPDGVGWNVAGGSSNFVLSEVNLSAGALDGDFNLDGEVDSADYVMWRKNAGSAADYDLWVENFGATGGGGTGAKEFLSGGAAENLGSVFNTSGEQDLRLFFVQSDGSTVRGIVSYINGGSGGAVPEPNSLLLISVAALWIVGRGRRSLGCPRNYVFEQKTSVIP
jgi:hypothetical protein